MLVISPNTDVKMGLVVTFGRLDCFGFSSRDTPSSDLGVRRSAKVLMSLRLLLVRGCLPSTIMNHSGTALSDTDCRPQETTKK